MKKLLLMVLVCIGLMSCNQAGTVIKPNLDKFQINNKVYNVRFVTLHDGGGGIYVVYPENDTLNIPQTTTFPSGKTTQAVTIIK